MKKNPKVVTIITIIILLIISWRSCSLYIDNNIHRGIFKESPNKKLTAHFIHKKHKSFFGNCTSWFEYSVINNTNNQTVYFWKTDPIPGESFGARTPKKLINRNLNSKQVIYKFSQLEIKIDIKN